MAKMLEELKNKMEQTAVDYANAYNAHEKKSSLKAKKSAAKSALDEYNLELSKDTYRQWNAEGDPVLAAIRQRFIPHAQKCAFKVNDETDFMTVVFSDTEYLANLPMMQATIGKDVFAKPDWFNKCEKLAYLIAGRLNTEICDNPSFSYETEEASRSFEFENGVNPLTDDGVVAALQQVFDSILFLDDGNGSNLIHTTLKQHPDGKYYSPEWTTIRESMTHAGGINSVAICNTGKMTEYVMNAMYGVLTHGKFTFSVDEK